MKLAVLADIHANWPALQTVAGHIEAWRPDCVIVAGDVVNRGPRPLECLRFVQDSGWSSVRGNHEEYVMTHAEPDSPRSGPQFEIWQGSFYTYRRLNEDVSALGFRSQFQPPSGHCQWRRRSASRSARASARPSVTSA